MVGNIDKAIKFMKENPGCFIRPHRLGTKKVYRLLDSKINPVVNIMETEFRPRMEDGTFIQNEEGLWILDN